MLNKTLQLPGHGHIRLTITPDDRDNHSGDVDLPLLFEKLENTLLGRVFCQSDESVGSINL